MLLSSYKALGLINDEHHPEPILRRLVDPAQRKDALREILKSTYAEVLSLGSAATQKQFDDQMGSYGVGGDTKKKAKSFFVQAAEMAGIPLSPYIASAKSSSNGSSAPRSTTQKRRTKKAKTQENNTNNSGARDPERQTRLHPAVQAWIDEMPDKDDSRDRADFENWLTIFKASVERAYKI